MTSLFFTVHYDSPLVGMTMGDIETKYNIKIIHYKPEEHTYVDLYYIFPSTIIKPNFILTVEGESTYDIFRDATGYYEIDA